MDKQTRDKMICEALELCYHEYEIDSKNKDFAQCRKCRLYALDLPSRLQNLNFDSWTGFGVIMERGKTSDWWKDFVYKLTGSIDVGFGLVIQLELINPPVMSEALAEFWEGRKK